MFRHQIAMQKTSKVGHRLLVATPLPLLVVGYYDEEAQEDDVVVWVSPLESPY
jgi:hypothetical protein